MPYPSGADEKVEVVGSAGGDPQVQGSTADGQAATANPVLVAGQDGTNVQSILTDTAGRQVVVGAAADGAAVAGNPVLMAGQDGTNAQSVLTDTTGRQVMVGAAAVGAGAAGNPVYIAGRDDSGNISAARLFNPTGDGIAAAIGHLFSTALGYIINSGGALDRVKAAAAADGTTGTGVPASGVMAFDGTNYQVVPCDTTGTPRVGRHTTAIKSAPTVQAAAYAAADLVGGKQTFTSAARVSGGSGRILGIVIGDQAANSAANSVYDLIIFDADPTGTTFTENSPLDVADADLNKTIAVVRFDGVAGTTLFANADNQVLYRSVDIPFQCSGTANLFGALIARGAPTYAATTDVFVTLLIQQN